MQRSFGRRLLTGICLLSACCSLAFTPGRAGAVTMGELVDRFFPPPAVKSQPKPEIPLPSLPSPQQGDPNDIDRHNEGVRLNNEGIQAMNEGRFGEAEALFRRAIETDPHEKGPWNNLILSLQRQGGRGREIYEAALQLMARDSRDSHGPYAAGQVLLDELKSPREAIPFFEEALKRSPDDHGIAVALAQACERAGYLDHALDLLKQAAPRVRDDPYPQYLLGNLLLGRREYVPAIRAFQSVLDRDREGFIHDAWLRARFYAGQLDGLSEAITAALSRYPNILNRQSLEKIAFCLGTRRYRLVETITVQVGNPSALRKLDFLIRMPPQMPGFQKVLLERAVLLADGREAEIQPSEPDADGRVRFRGVEGLRGPTVKLRMSYDIERRPWLGSRGPFQPAPEPDIEELKRDPRLSLDNPVLEAIDRRLRSMDGNFLQNAFLAVGQGLAYRENFEDKDVNWALANPDTCDCTEYAWLLTALCLKRGLPARVMTGFLVKSELVGRETNVGHAWVDVYFKGKGWVPADPTLGATMQWAYFGNLLSDQIMFDHFDPSRKARVSIDFTSTQATMPVTIGNSYLITVLP